MDKYVYIHLKTYKYRTIYLDGAPPPPRGSHFEWKIPKNLHLQRLLGLISTQQKSDGNHHLHYSQSTEDRSSWVSSKIQDFCTREALDCLWMEAPPAK